MRVAITILFFSLFIGAFAQDTTSHAGFYAQLNASRLWVTSSPKSTANVQSVAQWSAGGGVYWMSRLRNNVRFELQLGYESTGSGREIYFVTANSLTRVYDRYRTVSTVAIARVRLPFWQRLNIGGGIKSNLVINHEVRNKAIMSSPPSVIIISPDVKRLILSGIAEMVVTFPKAEIGIQAWYGFIPLIEENNTKVNASGLSLTVKAYIW